MANDFSADTRCKALWRFETGALIADTGPVGTNTLTSFGTPAEDLVDFKEGACCVDLEYSTPDYYTIADAALSAGFPLKNGDATKKLTWCAWIKQESQAGTVNYFLSKHDTVNNKRSLAALTGANILHIYCGYNAGASFQDINTSISIANGEWYHVAVVIDGIAKTLSIRVYKVSNDTVYTYSTTISNEINVEDAAFSVGGKDGDTTYRWDGKIDEVVVFDNLLTDAEIDLIRLGTFVPAIQVPQVLAQVEYAPPASVQVYQLLAQVEYTTTDVTAITAVIGSGGVKVGGVGVIAFLTPDIEAVIGTGGVEVGGEGVIEFLDPDVLAVVGKGGVEVGGEGIIEFASGNIEAVIGYGGVEVGGQGVIELLSLAETALTIVAVTGSGGVVTGGTGVIEFLSPSVFAVVGSGGVVVGSPLESTVIGFVEYASGILAVVGSGGVRVGGAGVVGLVSLDASTTVAVIGSGGVAVGGVGVIEFLTPSVFDVVGSGGVIVGEFRPPEITVVGFVSYDIGIAAIVGSGGIEVGGAGVIAFTENEDSIYAVPLPQSAADADVVVGGAGVISFVSHQILAIIGEGGVVVGGGESIPPDVFETYVMTGARGEPSIYSGFNFNSYAKYRGKYYGAGAAGLYSLEGTDDAGEDIYPGMKIGPLNLGTNREKRLRIVRLGGETTGAEVKVHNGNGLAEYIAVDNGRVPVSMKVEGKEIFVEITDFGSLDHIEIVPLVLHKK